MPTATTQTSRSKQQSTPSSTKPSTRPARGIIRGPSTPATGKKVTFAPTQGEESVQSSPQTSTSYPDLPARTNLEPVLIRKASGKEILVSIAHVEGDIPELPAKTREDLQEFRADHPDAAWHFFRPATQTSASLLQGSAGSPVGFFAEWVDKPLRFGRFLIHGKSLLTIVRAPSGSMWEEGKPMIIIREDKKTYRVWRG